MTHIEQAIREAIDDGYDLKIGLYGEYIRFSHDGSRVDVLVYQEILLDLLFWRALGKAREWEDTMFPVEYQKTNGDREPLYWKGENGHQYTPHVEGWRFHWHRFIDHLAEAKDAESFFADLLT